MARRRSNRRQRAQGRNPYIQQANLESRVRYGPERSALRELLREARDDLASAVAAEEGAAQGIRSASRSARPRIGQIYSEANRSFAEADSDAARALAGLSSAADPFRAVAAREQAGARRRLAESKAGAEKELTDRSVQAEHGRQYGIRQAFSRYSDDARKVRSRQQSLAGEAGAFKLATMKDLEEAAAKAGMDAAKFQLEVEKMENANRNAELGRKVTMRGQDITRRGQDLSAKGKGKGFSRGALSSHQKIVAGIQDAASMVKRIRRENPSLSQQEIVALLTNPKKSPTKKDPGNPYGGYGPYTARAATSLVVNGHIKSHLLSGLKQRGLLVHRTPRKWKTKPRPRRDPSRPKTLISPW